MWSVTTSFKEAVVTGLCVRAGWGHSVLEQGESNKKCEFGICRVKKVVDARDRAQVSLAAVHTPVTKSEERFVLVGSVFTVSILS